MSYKVACRTTVNEPWAYNAMRFATTEEAHAWGVDLYARWTSLRDFEIHESSGLPNYTVENGQFTRISEEANA